MGHIIVDINLKGLPHDISGKEVMGIASGALKDLINFDTNTYGNIYDCATEFCGEQWSIGVVLLWMIRNHASLIAYLGVPITPLLVTHFDKVEILLSLSWYFWLLVAFVVTFFLVIKAMWLIYPLILHDACSPLIKTLKVEIGAP